jgi:lipopolysaccharide biosynthesis regulator YciM
VQRDFHLLPVVLPRLAEVARQSGDEGVLTAVIDDLIRRGAASRAEIAYAAILSGHYDSAPVVDCVREWLQIDSDLKDLTGAFLPPGTPPTVEQLRALSAAMRNIVLRHARYRCSECGLDSSTFLWSCPGCHAWDTLRAIAALEFLPRAARPRSRQ